MPLTDILVFILIYIITTYFYLLNVDAKNVPFSKYRSILTRNYSKRWLLHMSERQSTTNPYCNICCLNITQHGIVKDCGYHTLCLYKQEESRAHCRGFMTVKFTESEKYMILDAHNTVRNRVASGEEKRGINGPQPSASNMRRLEWDNELASIAERWAAQCTPTYDRCRDVERFPVGQNVAFETASKSNHLSFIQNWSDKAKSFNGSTVTAFSFISHAHAKEYTQLMWAESYMVGCARSVFQLDRGPDVFYKELLVCNYGPSGNIPGQPVYIPGRPCRACYIGTNCEAEYPSLCARGRKEMLGEETIPSDLNENDILYDMNDYIQKLDPNKNYNGDSAKFYSITQMFMILITVIVRCVLYIIFIM